MAKKSIDIGFKVLVVSQSPHHHKFPHNPKSITKYSFQFDISVTSLWQNNLLKNIWQMLAQKQNMINIVIGVP
jgi:(p)ppGpp synthase/HD superfamily hydrolase